ncbi:MAG: Rrf2 family transcriptional regulator [Planctomycetes bacterium]|nr:Rrf2 family transcriptional regulator [Planctomycetota bacterium]
MVLRQTAIYALRALAVLARLGPAERLTVEQLNEQTAAPRDYLSKIMRRLVTAGLVDGRKGHGGGFALARPRRQIRIRHVLEALGEPFDSEGCVFGWARCSSDAPCPLHPMWVQLRERLQAWANSTTLCDTLDDPSRC